MRNIKKLAYDLFINMLSNVLAVPLFTLAFVLLVIVAIFLRNILSRPVFSIPLYLYLVIFGLGGAAMYLIITLPGWLRTIRWNGTKEIAGFYWHLHYGHIIEGPNCPYCKKPVQPLGSDLYSGIQRFLNSEDEYILHTCGEYIPKIFDQDEFTKDVGAAIYANIRWGRPIHG